MNARTIYRMKNRYPPVKCTHCGEAIKQGTEYVEGKKPGAYLHLKCYEGGAK